MPQKTLDYANLVRCENFMFTVLDFVGNDGVSAPYICANGILNVYRGAMRALSFFYRILQREFVLLLPNKWNAEM